MHGVAVQQLEHGLEVAAEVRLDELADVRLLLDIHAKRRVLEDLRLERRARQGRERA
jgi:hypothetical protein